MYAGYRLIGIDHTVIIKSDDKTRVIKERKTKEEKERT
jgi:hypothetical protein